MTALTQEQQLFLELVNRARMDPVAEAARFNIGLNQFIQPTSQQFPITPDPKQPLAGNNILALVAQNHSSTVFAKALAQGNLNFDAHNGAGDGAVSARIQSAGYSQNAVSWIRPENFAMRNVSGDDFGTPAKKQAAIEAMHAGLFIDDPANSFGEPGGHRLAMMDPGMKEMGAGMTWGTFQGMPHVMAFENFGSSGPNSFLTGSVYNDNVINDDFYSLGEAVSNVTVQVINSAGAEVGRDVTGSGGGWSVSEPGGTYKVVFSGAGIGSVSATVDTGNLNAKVDLVDGNKIEASASTTLGDGARDLKLLGMSNINGTGNGLANVITGNKGNNILDGKAGNDTVDGGAGSDIAVLSGKLSDYQVTVLSASSARLVDNRGIDGADTIVNVERVQFADGLVDFSALKTTAVPVAGAVTVSDVTITEGNNGQTFANFVVTRSGGSAPFALNFATANGTAVAGSDFVAKSGTLQFAQGVTSQTVSIAITGDTVVEANEAFKLVLSGATNGATLARSEAIATIVNDDVAPANVKPVVTAHDVTLHAKKAIAGSALFSATDANGNGTIQKYGFWDGGSAGGQFVVNGVAQDASKWIFVNAADLGKVSYVAGVKGGAETLWVTAFDGTSWSASDSLKATTLKMSPNDFNGDGSSDVLWHNKNGNVAMWQMNDTKIISNTNVGTVKGWTAADIADFGGNGKADVLWVNDATKAVAMWQMNGNQIASNTTVGKLAAGWSVEGAADFTGDGKADVLLSNASGALSMWQMNGSSIAATKAVTSLGNGWHVEGLADFNGDGKADMLLRSDSGAVSMRQMDGSTILASKSVGTIGNSWHFAGAEDFNGDRKADILWHHDNGTVALWQMDGFVIKSNTTVGSASTAWDIANLGDYDRDGKADILWQNDSGAVAMWQMDGAHIDANASIGSAASSWLLV